MRLFRTLTIGHSGLTILAFIAGTLFALISVPEVEICASVISDVFMKLLRLVSVPIIFLSLLVTIGKVGTGGQAAQLLKRIVIYTLFTTIVAAFVALVLSVLIHPIAPALDAPPTALKLNTNYMEHLLSVVPTTWVQPFIESNVLGVLVLALGLGFAITRLDEKPRALLHSFFDACFQTVMVVTRWIVKLLPTAVFAFSYLFVRDLRNGPQLEAIGLYLVAVIGANLIQGLIVLPLILTAKGISPTRTFVGMWPALSLAFFSKSSAGTIPLAIRCAEERLSVPAHVARFSFPLCTTINMNACAGFILITVLFVSQSAGVVFTSFDMVLWVFIATIAAIGNAGVPMGCYFLSGALLTTMNVPLTLLGVILPFYAIIDMFETAINVWSDSCVTVIAAKEAVASAPVSVVEAQLDY